MRFILLLCLTVSLSAPALAWVPKLDEATAQQVIAGAYGRREAVATYQTVDLTVKDGQFAAGPESVKVFDGGGECLSRWLAAPADFTAGSRPLSVTAMGQADQLYFQAVSARDSFKNLSAAEALGPELTAARQPDGELRVDIRVQGLPTEKARDAYSARLRGAEGQLLSPTRRSYVDDFKQEGGVWSGTIVFYFDPLAGGLTPSSPTELLLRTEADTNCAYSVALNLAAFL